MLKKLSLLGEPLRVFRHYFFRCFYFSPLIFATLFLFFIVDCTFSYQQLCSFFARQSVFVLLYRECYGSERAFVTFRSFLPYTSSRYLAQCCECCRFQRAFFTLRLFLTLHSFPIFGTTCFFQGFPGAGSSSMKVVEPPSEV